MVFECLVALRSRYVFGQEEDCIFPPDRANVLGEVFCVKVETVLHIRYRRLFQLKQEYYPYIYMYFFFSWVGYAATIDINRRGFLS